MNDIFNFRLQRVLDYRRHMKEEKSELLARYREQLNREKDILKDLRDQKNTSVSNMDEKYTEGVSIGHLAQYGRYMDQLKTFIDRQAENVLEMNNRVEKCRENLMEASQKKEMLDRLKKRHYERFVYHLSKEQEKHVEDLVNNRRVNL